MTDAPGERQAEAWRPAPHRDGGAGGFFSQAGVRFGMIYACLFGASSLAPNRQA